MTLDDKINRWLDTTNEITGQSIRRFLDEAGYAIISKKTLTLGAAALDRLLRDSAHDE